MPEPDTQELYVLTAAPTHAGSDGRPVSVRGFDGGLSIANVPMGSFKVGMANFMNSVRSLVADIEQKAGGYEIDQVEIAASIGADGKVSFLGSGVGVETSASFTITLKRPKDG